MHFRVGNEVAADNTEDLALWEANGILYLDHASVRDDESLSALHVFIFELDVPLVGHAARDHCCSLEFVMYLVKEFFFVLIEEDQGVSRGVRFLDHAYDGSHDIDGAFPFPVRRDIMVEDT